MRVSAQEIRAIVTNATCLKGQLEDETIFTAAGIDSLDLYTILMGIEEKYGISIPDSEASDLRSIHSIITYLESRIE